MFADASKEFRLAAVALLLVYGFGILGMFTPFRPWFTAMTPLSLLLSWLLLCRLHPNWNSAGFYFMATAFVVGVGAELLGVNTGFPFGAYRYGAVLGPQILGTPLLIGVNWTLVTYCSNEVLNRLAPARTPAWVMLAGGALLPTLLDVLIEPVAIRLGFWSWAAGVPPLQNYAGWFGVSLLIGTAYRYWMPPTLRNPLSPLLLALQWLFFAVLQVL